MIYRFSRPIYLTNGKVIGNADPKAGPLGGEVFFDKDEDNEIQNAVKAQVAKEAEEAVAATPKKNKN